MTAQQGVKDSGSLPRARGGGISMLMTPVKSTDGDGQGKNGFWSQVVRQGRRQWRRSVVRRCNGIHHAAAAAAEEEEEEEEDRGDGGKERSPL